MWIVCNLKTDRAAKPSVVSGTWANGAVTESRIYPTKAVPSIETFGKHKTRNDAVKALVLLYHPELVNSSIEHLKRVSKCFLRGSM